MQGCYVMKVTNKPFILWNGCDRFYSFRVLYVIDFNYKDEFHPLVLSNLLFYCEQNLKKF